MVRKVAIYSRVSTLDQTIDNQLLGLRDHCSKMGWEIVKEYTDEGLSGTLSREKRPSLNAMIKDAPMIGNVIPVMLIPQAFIAVNSLFFASEARVMTVARRTPWGAI